MTVNISAEHLSSCILQTTEYLWGGMVIAIILAYRNNSILRQDRTEKSIAR